MGAVLLYESAGYASHEDLPTSMTPPLCNWPIEKGKTNLTLRTLTKILLIHGLTIEEFFTSLPKESRKPARSPQEWFPVYTDLMWLYNVAAKLYENQWLPQRLRGRINRPSMTVNYHPVVNTMLITATDTVLLLHLNLQIGFIFPLQTILNFRIKAKANDRLSTFHKCT